MRNRTIRMSVALAAGLALGLAGPPRVATADHQDGVWLPVAGSGVHFFTTVIVHSQEPTETGMIQRSTDTVDLTGDLKGRVLYHPTSVFDFVNGTLVNTGEQVFSGTVLGSAPVMIHDDEFRFDVNLNTGETVGEVHFTGRIAGPKVRCHLDVVGTGTTPEGNAKVDYTGRCKFNGN
jgi:hypothetical protein